jgi:hypothetical protein
MEERLMTKSQADEDEDMFLMSLLPSIKTKELDDIQRLKLRK